jgi:hypothetical protein
MTPRTLSASGRRNKLDLRSYNEGFSRSHFFGYQDTALDKQAKAGTQLVVNGLTGRNHQKTPNLSNRFLRPASVCHCGRLCKKGTDEQLQSTRLLVCILHAVIGDVSLLCFLSVPRINNLRVFNTCAGSTPAASTIQVSCVHADSYDLRPPVIHFFTPRSEFMCVKNPEQFSPL